MSELPLQEQYRAPRHYYVPGIHNPYVSPKS
jgi:hypothetical protein